MSDVVIGRVMAAIGRNVFPAGTDLDARDVRHVLENAALAAMEAIREPCEGMKAMGRMRLKTSEAISRFDLAADVWEAMLLEAAVRGR